MGLAGKVQNLVFPNLKLYFHDTTLEAYLHRYVCADHMVDGALKTMGLAVLKHDNKKIVHVISIALRAEKCVF